MSSCKLLISCARNLLFATALISQAAAFSRSSTRIGEAPVNVFHSSIRHGRYFHRFLKIRDSRSSISSKEPTFAEDIEPPSDQDDWKAMLLAFRMYKAAYGDLKVPSRFVVPSLPPWPEISWGMKLGHRVAAIRSEGKYIQNEERRKVLDDMGFVWRLRALSKAKDKEDKAVSFEQIFSALKIYREQIQPGTGSLSVPASFVVPDCDPWPETTRGLPLGRKVGSIRSKSFLAANPGSQEKLKSIGFQIDGKVAANDARFQLVYDALQRYKEIFGDLFVPQPFIVPRSTDWPEPTWGLRLGARVNAIRSQGTFVKNNPERRKLLDDLGFMWSPPKSDARGRPGRKASSESEGLPGSPLQRSDLENPAKALDEDANFFNAFDFVNEQAPLAGEKGGGDLRTWGFDSGQELEEAMSQHRPSDEGQANEEIQQERNLESSLEDAKVRALAVGVIEEIPGESRTRKGKREKSIPWFNDDFGDEFVFEDVVEGLRIYKSIYGDFSNLTDEGFVIPSQSDAFSGLDGMETRSEVDSSSTIASYEAEKILDEFQVMEDTDVQVNTAISRTAEVFHWPEHLGGMVLGNIVKRIRDGSLEVRHLPERKAMLDELDFDWGDPKYFIDVPFEKTMCAMYAYYLVRGDMFVYEDFIMPDEDPWPRALAGYEIGKAVHRIRELQNFMEAYHPEKVSLLRMIDFVWFPTLALPLDPNEPEMTPEMLRLSALGHPDYSKMIDIPMGLPDKIVADGPFFETDDPKLWWRKWHNWDYVQDYWYQQGRRDNAFVLRGMGFPQMAEEHEAKYGPGLFQLINETMTEVEGGMEGKSPEEVSMLMERLAFYRQEMTDCTDIHPQDRRQLLEEMDSYLLDFAASEDDIDSQLGDDVGIESVEYEEEEVEVTGEVNVEEGEWIEDEDLDTLEEDDFDVASQLGLDFSK